jgi:hypothetical protein
MAPAPKAGTPTGAGHFTLPKLPPVTVNRVEQAATLLERLFDENVSLFIRKGQEFRDKHRESTSRPLFAEEAAQLAAALADTDEERVAVAEQLQAGSLRAYDEPQRTDILLAAGLATSPALMAAVRKVVALVEMPADTFKTACVDDALDQKINEAAVELGELELDEARARAGAAMEHYAKAAGFSSGEAWRLPVQSVWQALVQAVNQTATGSPLSQLIDSAPSTADSTATTSSTSSPGPTPSS